MKVWVGKAGGQVHPEAERIVRNGFEAGESDERIAELLGVSGITAKRVRLALGLTRGDAPAPPEVSDDELRRLHADELTNAAIAERTGMTVAAVRTRLSRLGLASNRGERRDRLVNVRVTAAQHERLRAMAAEQGTTISSLLLRAVGLE